MSGYFSELCMKGLTFQPAFTCSKLTILTLEQGVKNVQSSGIVTYFAPCSSVSIVNFEHIISGWVIFSVLIKE